MKSVKNIEIWYILKYISQKNIENLKFLNEICKKIESFFFLNDVFRKTSKFDSF